MVNLRFRPRAIVFKRNGRHELEIQAGSTYQTVHSCLVAGLFNFWKVFFNDLGNSLQRFRRCLVPLVLASPLTADTVEAHGTIGQWNIRQGRVGARVLVCNRSKGLRERKREMKQDIGPKSALENAKCDNLLLRNESTYRSRSQSSYEKRDGLHNSIDLECSQYKDIGGICLRPRSDDFERFVSM